MVIISMIVRVYLEYGTGISREIGWSIDYLMDYILFGGGWSVLRYCWGCKSIVL